MTHLRKGSKLVLMMMTSPLFLLILRAQVRYWRDTLVYTCHCFGAFMINFSSTYADHAFVLALHEVLVFFFQSMAFQHTVCFELSIWCLSFWQCIWWNLECFEVSKFLLSCTTLYILIWKCELQNGAAGTPYENGVFRMKLLLSRDFPHSPPKGKVIISWLTSISFKRLLPFETFRIFVSKFISFSKVVILKPLIFYLLQGSSWQKFSIQT